MEYEMYYIAFILIFSLFMAGVIVMLKKSRKLLLEQVEETAVECRRNTLEIKQLNCEHEPRDTSFHHQQHRYPSTIYQLCCSACNKVLVDNIKEKELDEMKIERLKSIIAKDKETIKAIKKRKENS